MSLRGENWRYDKGISETGEGSKTFGGACWGRWIVGDTGAEVLAGCCWGCRSVRVEVPGKISRRSRVK